MMQDSCPSLKLVKIRVVSKIPLSGECLALGYPWKGLFILYIAIFLREYWSIEKAMNNKPQDRL